MNLRPIPNRLSAKVVSEVMAPPTTALVAMRLGHADTEHYHALAGALSIAYRAAEMVQRHNHLLVEIQPGLDALTAIFRRHAGKADDVPYSGTPEEIDRIEDSMKVYRAIIVATPGKTMRRAIQRALMLSGEPTEETP